MRLAQELPTEMRERLEEEAARRGEAPDALLLSLVNASLSRPLTVAAEGGLENSSADHEAERFRHWADGQPRRGVPVIPMEALDHEHIYEDYA